MNRPLIVGCCLLLCCACERKPKRVLRTEPWPAAAASSTGAENTGRPLRYELERSSVKIELRGTKAKPEATIGDVRGTLDFDPARPELSRATLRADLLSLSVAIAGSEDPALVARAFEWLELAPERPAQERERDRWAVLEISGFTSAVPRDTNEPLPRRGAVTAHGTLTLHHFRVPLELALDVDLGRERGDRVTIRTQRPFVVSLAAHDILPRDARGQLTAGGLAALGKEVGREARVSAELSFKTADPPSAEPKNP